MSSTEFDIVVVGAGIAGSSAAAELATFARVLLIEMESQPGFHATGRSAAYFASSYGSKAVRAITRASEAFYRQPPRGFTQVDLIKPRDALFIARADQQKSYGELQAEVQELHAIDSDQARSMVSVLKPSYVHAGLVGKGGGDLDVDAILQGYLRSFRSRGGALLCNRTVQRLEYKAGRWSIHMDDETVRAPILINAAGAWAGQLAGRAGLDSLGLQPKRRTAVLIKAPANCDTANWPLVIDIDEQFYFKPDAGLLLVSPADATPSEPCDAQADELDIAIAIDRLQQATSIEVQRIEHRWAGLRTFAPDKEFILGSDPRTTGFIWFAGQGGYGVQSAPALAKMLAAKVNGSPLPEGFEQLSSYYEPIHPARLLRN